MHAIVVWRTHRYWNSSWQTERSKEGAIREYARNVHTQGSHAEQGVEGCGGFVVRGDESAIVTRRDGRESADTTRNEREVHFRDLVRLGRGEALEDEFVR